MSTLVLMLAAGMTVPGDVPKEAMEEIEQRLDLGGEWEGMWYGGRTGVDALVYLSGTRITLLCEDSFTRYHHRITDEGKNKLRFLDVPGIYEHDGDRLLICFRMGFGSGRPTSFQAGDGQVLLILHRVKSRK